MKSVSFLREKFPKFKVGYSDHSLSTDSCKIAIMLGAFMVEKHFTLDKNTSNFHDHKISADPKELKNLVNFSKKNKWVHQQCHTKKIQFLVKI